MSDTNVTRYGRPSGSGPLQKYLKPLLEGERKELITPAYADRQCATNRAIGFRKAARIMGRRVSVRVRMDNRLIITLPDEKGGA